MKVVAKVISRIFDPVLEVPLMLLAVVSLAYLNGYRYKLFLALFVFDALIPAMMVIYLFIKNRGQDWDIHDRIQRLPLFTAIVFGHGLGVLATYWLNRHPLAEILLALWLLAVIYALIMPWWKISVHTGVNATLVMLILQFVSIKYWWLLLIVPLVAWARVVHRDHDLLQVSVGGAIPMILLPVLFSWWGVA